MIKKFFLFLLLMPLSLKGSLKSVYDSMISALNNVSLLKPDCGPIFNLENSITELKIGAIRKHMGIDYMAK